jgi:hypothetical protein
MHGYCFSCKHKRHEGDCTVCGCTRYKDRRQRLRTWVVNVEFLVRNRWVGKDVRVKAVGQAGAAQRAVQEAKALALKPRTRVAQVRLTLTPVPQPRAERG